MTRDLLVRISAIRAILGASAVSMTRLADGSMVVLHLDRGLVFSLNETAAALVSAVMAGREDVESIEQALGTEFDLEGVNVEQEVERVLLAFSCLQNGLAEAARRP